MCVSSSNNSYARLLATSVLPTPVGPKNINVPIGLLGSFIPLLERSIALLTNFNASSCPLTRFFKLSYKCKTFSFSLEINFDKGILVHLLITLAMSSLVTTSDKIPSLPFLLNSLSFSFNLGNTSFLILAAVSKS